MKTKLIALSLFYLFTLIGCKREPFIGEYNMSLNSWLYFKKESGNSYKYRAFTGSFTGYRSETTIYVRDGGVVKRQFMATGGGINMPFEEWTEEQSSIGTHTSGSPAVTLDEVYTQAKDNWLKKRDNAKTYFETKNAGIISMAGYVENNCADDCFIGININLVEEESY